MTTDTIDINRYDVTFEKLNPAALIEFGIQFTWWRENKEEDRFLDWQLIFTDYLDFMEETGYKIIEESFGIYEENRDNPKSIHVAHELNEIYHKLIKILMDFDRYGCWTTTP